MGLPSYETIEKLLFPENKKQKVVGCVLLLFITNGIIFAILKEVTWAHFFKYYLRISIMAFCWLNIWYVVYGLIRERRLKRLKEIYESYYSLIVHTDPYWGKLRFLLDKYDKKTQPLEFTGTSDTFCFEDDEKVTILSPGEKLPKCFYTAVTEVCRITLTNYDSLFIDIRAGGKDPSLLYNFRKHSTINALFKWHIDKGSEVDPKGIPLLSTDDDKPIRGINDLQRLWEELGLKGLKSIVSSMDFSEFSDTIKGMTKSTLWKLLDGKEEIENHLRDKHNKNLNRLGDC